MDINPIGLPYVCLFINYTDFYPIIILYVLALSKNKKKTIYPTIKKLGDEHLKVSLGHMILSYQQTHSRK